MFMLAYIPPSLSLTRSHACSNNPIFLFHPPARRIFPTALQANVLNHRVSQLLLIMYSVCGWSREHATSAPRQANLQIGAGNIFEMR